METPKNYSIEPIWLHHWLSQSGDKLLSYYIQDSLHWLRFPNLADFRISNNANDISCFSQPGIPEETIRHLLLDQVLPRCLAYQGKIMLHASAVQHEKGLILFVGDSGAGKSTLAGELHLTGNPAISDDCLWIKDDHDQVEAVPSYGGLRLWGDSLQVLFAGTENTASMAHYSIKKRVSLGETEPPSSNGAIPILAIFVIFSSDHSSSPGVMLERLSRREAIIAMLKQSFQLNPLELNRMTRHMQALGRIVLRIPAYRLSMPHKYDLLPLVRKKILEAVL